VEILSKEIARSRWKLLRRVFIGKRTGGKVSFAVSQVQQIEERGIVMTPFQVVSGSSTAEESSKRRCSFSDAQFDVQVTPEKVILTDRGRGVLTREERERLKEKVEPG